MDTELRSFDLTPKAGHGTIFEEWAPHDRGIEWWYATGYLDGDNGRKYFYQVNIFHFPFLKANKHSMDAIISDYKTGQHIHEQTPPTYIEGAYKNGDTLTYLNEKVGVSGNWKFNPQTNLLNVKTPNIEMSLQMADLKGAVWHGKRGDGVLQMGLEDKLSFYYSVPNNETTGWILYLDRGGNRINTKVKGKSWLDRQWGTMDNKVYSWDWFSLRFFDNEEVMIFSFPQYKYKDATYFDKNSNVCYFDNYTYSIENFVKKGNNWFGVGWTLELPFKEKKYRIVPLSFDDVNVSKYNAYHEGLCNIYNNRGELVGYGITETMDIKLTCTSPEQSKI